MLLINSFSLVNPRQYITLVLQEGKVRADLSLYLQTVVSVQDTFYDPEDGSTRSLRLSLLTMDRSQVPPMNWLQFDVKNQEFYGTPMREDEGRKEYQLVRLLQILFLSVFLVCAHNMYNHLQSCPGHSLVFCLILFLSLLLLPICVWS